MRLPDRNQFRITFDAQEIYFFGKARQRYPAAEKYIAGEVKKLLDAKFANQYMLTWSDDFTRRLAKHIGGVMPSKKMQGRIVAVLAENEQDAKDTYAGLTAFYPLKTVVIWLHA